MKFPIFEEKFVSELEFVNYWASRYIDMKEKIYRSNIGEPLTTERLLQLFEWKNGSKIARHKLKSIYKNYIDNPPIAPNFENKGENIKFISSEGGVIWRIFWLHCYSPEQYPIYDQHVYRAMSKIISGTASEISENNMEKAISYVEDYMPFHRRFNQTNKKKIDEALWTYGKFLKSSFAC